MLDKKDFEGIRNDLEQFENQRENVIKAARKVIQLSKRIIYSVHRGDLQVEPLIKEIKTAVKSLPEQYYDTDIDRVAIQEYVEAACYYEFIKSRKMPTRKDLGVQTELYLLGLCDLTGELVRKAVFASINKNYKLVLEIKELVQEIFGEFLKFDLRNGELRKKSDSIKYNLKKLEDMTFELKLKDKL